MTSSASVLSNNLALYMKDLKSLVSLIAALKLVASSFEWTINFLVLNCTLTWLNLNF